MNRFVALLYLSNIPKFSKMMQKVKAQLNQTLGRREWLKGIVWHLHVDEGCWRVLCRPHVTLVHWVISCTTTLRSHHSQLLCLSTHLNYYILQKNSFTSAPLFWFDFTHLLLLPKLLILSYTILQNSRNFNCTVVSLFSAILMLSTDLIIQILEFYSHGYLLIL